MRAGLLEVQHLTCSHPDVFLRRSRPSQAIMRGHETFLTLLAPPTEWVERWQRMLLVVTAIVSTIGPPIPLVRSFAQLAMNGHRDLTARLDPPIFPFRRRRRRLACSRSTYGAARRRICLLVIEIEIVVGRSGVYSHLF